MCVLCQVQYACDACPAEPLNALYAHWCQVAHVLCTVLGPKFYNYTGQDVVP